MLGCVQEVLHDRRFGGPGETPAGDRGRHAGQPGVPLDRADDIGGVPHPQPRVSPLDAVVGGAAPILAQEAGEPAGRTGQVVGIQRSQHRVLRHSIVKSAGQVIEPIGPHQFEERVGHDLCAIGSDPHPGLLSSHGHALTRHWRLVADGESAGVEGCTEVRHQLGDTLRAGPIDHALYDGRTDHHPVTVTRCLYRL